MRKKLISLIAVLALVTICVACLVACNPYKFDGIGGGEPNAPVESNGGYAVKQGKYLYYINGYEGSDANNEWGKPTLQNIVRAELNEDGTVKNETTKVVVPKSIFNVSSSTGFAIFGEWIYYATPNYDKDKYGVASTTNTDFMRTKIDGSVTQRLGVINSRSAEYLFFPTRVLYYTSNTISYFDFSDLQTKKSTDSTDNSKKGDLATGVTSVKWKYGCDDIFYTQNATGTESYKNYNMLKAVKYDGTNERTLATQNTFLATGESAELNPQKVFKYTLQDMFVEADGKATLYYTMTYYIDSKDTTYGLFCAKADDFKGTHKCLNTIGSTTLFPLGYAEGALAYNKDNVYCWYNGENAEDPLQVTTTSQTVWYVKDGYAYVTANSGAKTLYKITYNKKVNNQTPIMEEGMKVDGLKLDFIGDNLFFFATDDENYTHVVNVKTFNKDEKDAKSTYIGFEREKDKEEEEE
ncbi:MAG: hypothetical protein K2J16_03735 [Clostridia bacterium]|nr:hypothetical protein [Clostridia bacterium]